MADKQKFVSKTGLRYFYNRIKTIFASKTELDTLDAKVDDIIAEGGEPNVIETVKVNGTALTPSSKAVDVPVPTKASDLTNDGDGTSKYATESYVDENGGKIDTIKVNGTEQTITNKSVDIPVPTKLSEFTNDGDGTANSKFATEKYVTDNGGKIDTIKVNGTAQTITNKSVDLDIPTKVSDLTNDSKFQTDAEVEAAIAAKIVGVYNPKGSVANAEALPTTGNTKGDVYDTLDTGMNYVWDGSKWDALGPLIDESTLWKKDELEAITTAEIDAIIDGTE